MDFSYIKKYSITPGVAKISRIVNKIGGMGLINILFLCYNILINMYINRINIKIQIKA